MSDKITIKFKPEGDKDLIRAINALSKAQAELNNKVASAQSC